MQYSAPFSNPNPDIYKASAGSGKTFRLTLNYLKLALRHPRAFSAIQAVTFTNKATAEMKERIVQVMRALATNDKSPQIQHYRIQLIQELSGIDEDALTTLASDCYSQILHDYSRFSISTIDAFVQRIIRAFAWELGIDGGFKLQLAVDPVKEALTNKLYNQLDHNDALLQWMVTMAKERLEADKSWNPRQSLMDLSDEIFKEQYQAFESSLAGKTDAEISEAFTAMRDDAMGTIKSIEAKWQRLCDSIAKLMKDRHIEKEDLFNSGSGFIGPFTKTISGELPSLTATALKVISGEKPFVKKGIPAERAARVGEIEKEFIGALAQLQVWYEEDIAPYNTALAITKKLDTLRLVKILSEQLSAYRSEENALLMTDIHALLRRLTQDATVPFIYEKTGQQYQHYLIDEFQDTSRFQWGNFKPLIEESLSGGHYNMMVGDVKQAIYRWRNGDWRLLLEEVAKDLAPFHPQEKTLQENYRSSKQVIAFNNLLFHLAPQLLQDALNTMMQSAQNHVQQGLAAKGYDTIFNRAYADSYQQTPDTAPDNGYVQISFLPKDEELNYCDQVLQQLQQTVDGLLREGFSPGDIAILTRKNDEAKMVVEYLIDSQRQSGMQYNIMSGEALQLQSNLAVKLLLACMRWLMYANDTLAWAEMNYCYGLLQHHANVDHELFAGTYETTHLPPFLLQESRQLSGLPVNELVHQLIILFELGNHAQHAAFVMAFTDLVQASLQYGDTNLESFLQYWKDEGHRKALPSSADGNAVEVVTIHRSKGLAYTIVLVPFMQWDLPSKTNATHLVPTDGTRFNQLPVVAIPYTKALAESEFAAFYFEEHVLSVMDNLNMLYVAFTRARQRIYGWCADDAKNEIKHIGHLVYAVAGSTTAVNTPPYTDTRSGYDKDSKIWQFGHLVAPAQAVAISPKPMSSMTFSQWRDKLQVRYRRLQTAHEAEQLLPREQGLLLHDILQRMQHPEDLSACLQQMNRSGLLDESAIRKAKQLIEKITAMEALQPWQSGQYKRLAEQPMLNPQKQLRRADMILYNEKETLVYDFKFTETEKQRDKHIEQVREYMTLLQTMQFPQVKGYIIYGYSALATTVTL